MERIAVDMDGVLADVFEQFLDWDERDTGERKDPEAIIGISELEAFPLAKKYVYTENFFRILPVVKDSRQVLSQLNDRYEVYIVSAAAEFPQSLPEKQAWLSEHFPFISWQQMVFCGSKKIIKADIMIDDHFKNLDHFTGHTTLLFSQPHNRLLSAGRHRRVNSWQEIAEILL
jgi:5'-nucleotidase